MFSFVFTLVTPQQVGSFVRLLLAGVATTAVTKGYTDSSTATAVVGGVVAVATAAWGLASNTQTSLIRAVNVADNGVKVVSAAVAAPQVSVPLK